MAKACHVWSAVNEAKGKVGFLFAARLIQKKEERDIACEHDYLPL
jgi:hypothetical protein